MLQDPNWDSEAHLNWRFSLVKGTSVLNNSCDSNQNISSCVICVIYKFCNSGLLRKIGRCCLGSGNWTTGTITQNRQSRPKRQSRTARGIFKGHKSVRKALVRWFGWDSQVTTMNSMFSVDRAHELVQPNWIIYHFFKSHFDRERSDALCPYEHPQCWSIQNNQKDVPISLRGASRLDVPFSLSRNPPYGCIQTSEPAIAVFILDPDLMGLCVLLPRSGSRINTAFPAEVHSNMHEFHGFCSTNLLHF